MNTASIKPNTTRFAFDLVTSLFFLWGFSNNLNPILIPHLKKSFALTTTQSTLIDSAVYIAYFLVTLLPLLLLLNCRRFSINNLEKRKVKKYCAASNTGIAWYGWNGYKVKTVGEMEKEPAIAPTL